MRVVTAMKAIMKTGIVAVALVAAGTATLLLLGVGPFAKAAPASTQTAWTTVKVSRGDIVASVSASGKLEPGTITTIRPDSNMPTRKLVAILVAAGSAVREGQALARIDDSGLDLDLTSAKANWSAQKAKLDNLRARPADLDRRQADADLAQARITVESAQDANDSAKSLSDKGLVAKSQLDDAARQLAVAKLRYETAQLSWQNVSAQSTTDVIQAQEAAVAQAESELQRTRLIFDSATIRSPVSGVVAEVAVYVGDLVSPATALMSVIDPDPMLLQAQVNENDMAQVRLGQPAIVTPSGYPDLQIPGTVSQINLHAQVQGNVSVFQASIRVPNRDGRLLWGSNADAEISVLSLKDVLVLPSAAVKTANGASQVTILDEGKLLSWDVQVGPSDGTRTQIVAGLDEGEEVVVLPRKASTTAPTTQGGPGGTPGQGVNQIFRAFR